MTHIDTDIDWLACELIEQIPGKVVSGRPVSCGVRAFCPTLLWTASTSGKRLMNCARASLPCPLTKSNA